MKKLFEAFKKLWASIWREVDAIMAIVRRLQGQYHCPGCGKFRSARRYHRGDNLLTGLGRAWITCDDPGCMAAVTEQNRINMPRFEQEAKARRAEKERREYEEDRKNLFATDAELDLARAIFQQDYSYGPLAICVDWGGLPREMRLEYLNRARLLASPLKPEELPEWPEDN